MAKCSLGVDHGTSSISLLYLGRYDIDREEGLNLF